MSDPSAYFFNSGSVVTFSPASVQLAKGRTKAAIRSLVQPPAKPAAPPPPPPAPALALSASAIYAQRRAAAQEANRV